VRWGLFPHEGKKKGISQQDEQHSWIIKNTTGHCLFDCISRTWRFLTSSEWKCEIPVILCNYFVVLATWLPLLLEHYVIVLFHFYCCCILCAVICRQSHVNGQPMSQILAVSLSNIQTITLCTVQMRRRSLVSATKVGDCLWDQSETSLELFLILKCLRSCGQVNGFCLASRYRDPVSVWQ
jgi:hypothetical protein